MNSKISKLPKWQQFVIRGLWVFFLILVIGIPTVMLMEEHLTPNGLRNFKTVGCVFVAIQTLFFVGLVSIGVYVSIKHRKIKDVFLYIGCAVGLALILNSMFHNYYIMIFDFFKNII